MALKNVVGWRCWYDDDSVYSSLNHKWTELPEDGLLVRMIYYEGGGKQIQQGTDYFYEASHHSGESILGCGNNKDDISKRYSDVIIKRGRWAPDDYYRRIVEKAMNSTWDEPDLSNYEGCCGK